MSTISAPPASLQSGLESLAWPSWLPDPAEVWLPGPKTQTCMVHPPGGFYTPDGYARITDAGAVFFAFCAKYVILTKGRWANQKLILEPWQLFMFSEMLRAEPSAWMEIPPDVLLDPERLTRAMFHLTEDTEFPPGLRVYQEGYVQTSKKTGKSQLATALALFLLCADGEMGAEVFSAATSKEQSDIVFKQARLAVEKNPLLRDFVVPYSDRLHVPTTDSIYKELSWDPAGHEGINPSGGVIDELHRHQNRDLYDVIHSGTELREQPFVLNITNPGTDSDSICGQVYSQANAVLKGEQEARQDLYVFIPTIRVEDADDESQWKIANPLSVVSLDRIRANKRKYPPMVFQRRFLNMWTTSEESWVDMQMWAACEDKTLEPRDGDPCWIGVDLGMKHDTAGITITWKPRWTERLIQRAMVWGLRRSHAPGDEEALLPAHHIIDGDRLDLQLPEDFIRQTSRRFQVREVIYDPWRFERSAQALSAEGFTCVEWPQTDSRMVPATESYYLAISEGHVAHDGDWVLSAHVRNAVAEETLRGWRLAKRKARLPMDGCVAGAMSCSRAFQPDAEVWGNVW